MGAMLKLFFAVTIFMFTSSVKYRLPSHYLVSPPEIDRTSGVYSAHNGVRTFAYSETVKFGHVTFLWNGNRSGYFKERLEQYVEIPTDNGISVSVQPKMKALKIAEKTRDTIPSGEFDQVRVMVGHRGDIDATVVACEAADVAVKMILDAVEQVKGIYVVTADHGKAGKQPALDKEGKLQILTSHTLKPVPIATEDPGLSEGLRFRKDQETPGLANVASTVMNLQPKMKALEIAEKARDTIPSGVRTSACSENVKFGHVTFFWNGLPSDYGVHSRLHQLQLLIKASVAGLVASKILFTRSSLTLLWVFALCLTSAASAPVPIVTIMSPDGDVVDCINIQDQRAFQHPLLKNHQIQEPPINKEPEYVWQVWQTNGTRCPEGSIPVRRDPSGLTGTSGYKPRDRVNKDHEYAVGRMENQPKIYGTQVTMSVWHPHVEGGADEFSLAQVWLTSGSYKNNDLNSIEAGWQVYPSLYFDSHPRFFIYWTTDAYDQTGCYNLRCGGFVQTSKTVLLEGTILHTSIFGGAPTDLTIKIWKDQTLGSWWLGIITSNGILEPVGYWPAFLFTLQTDYAEKVEWGGEIVNTHSFGRHTSTHMGSGFFPDSGIGKVAYIRNLEIALSEKVFEPLQDLVVRATNPKYYQVEKINSTCFYYGGPGQIKSRAVHTTLDYIFIYFGFSLFLLV